MSPCFTFPGLAVDLIRRLWGLGVMRDNKWLKMCHQYWFDEWVAYRTCLTMQSVDQQIEEILEPSGVDKPVFTETVEGDTLLGGEMRLQAPWHDDQRSSSDSVQGPE